MGKGFDFTKDLLNMDEDTWSYISMGRLSRDFYLTFKDKINWECFDYKKNLLSIDDIKKLRNHIYWKSFSEVIQNEEIITKYQNFIDWNSLRLGDISKGFIDRFSDRINWVYLSKIGVYSFEFFESYMDRLPKKGVSYRDIKVRNFIKYFSKIQTMNAFTPTILNFEDISKIEFHNLVKRALVIGDYINDTKSSAKKRDICPIDITLTLRSIYLLSNFEEEDLKKFFSSGVINKVNFSTDFEEEDVIDKDFVVKLIELIGTNFDVHDAWVNKDWLYNIFKLNSNNEELIKEFEAEIEKNSMPF